MRTLIFLLTVLISSAMHGQTVYTTYIVTGNESWDLTTHPNGIIIEQQLIIEDSALLIINDLTLQFNPNNDWDGNVEIKGGGKLAAYNTIFKNRTNYIYWNGFRVRGNPAYPYYNLTQQGLLQLEDCQVQGAEFSILVSNGDGLYPFSGTGGGTIIIKNSEFKDCDRSIHVAESPLGYSQITDCSFEITQDFPLYQWMYPNSVPVAINLEYSKSRIIRCDFSTDLPLPLSGSPAIGIDGGNVVVSKSNITSYPAGIFATSFEPTDILEIKDNNMNVQNYGVHLMNQTNSVVIRNDIELWEPARGIYITESTNYSVEENYIHANAWFQNNTRGIEIQYNGLYNDEIYNNTIETMWYGIRAADNLVDEDHGLVIKCNKFTNNNFDIYVPNNGIGYGIFKYQGSTNNAPNAPAGNEFSWLAHPSYDYVNNSPEHINYVFHENSGLTHEPLRYVNQQTMTLIPNYVEYTEESCPSNFPPGGGGIGVPGDPNDPSTRMANMLEAKNAVTEIETLINQLKDGGHTNELITNINGSIPSEAYEIYLDLMSKSPYLSKEAIEAAIEKDNVIPNVMLRDIMVANPQSAKENELLESLDNRLIPMPDHMKAEIWSGIEIASALENLESIKSYYTRKVSRDHRYLAQHYMTDTVDEATSKQALTQLLQIGLKPEAYYQLAFMHLEDGNPSMGEQLLTTIPNEFELNSFQAAEFSSMMDYYAIRKQLQQNNQYLNNLNETQLNDLIEIATNGTGIAKGYACSILNLYGLCDFTYDLKNSSVNGESFAEKKALEYKRLQKVRSAYRFVSISPNPATDFLTVQIPEVNLSENALIKINSSDGKLIKQIELNTQQFETIIDVSELLPGAYILNFLNNGKLLESNRFIIVE